MVNHQGIPLHHKSDSSSCYFIDLHDQGLAVSEFVTCGHSCGLYLSATSSSRPMQSSITVDLSGKQRPLQQHNTFGQARRGQVW